MGRGAMSVIGTRQQFQTAPAIQGPDDLQRFPLPDPRLETFLGTKVIITGGLGLIGSALARQLVRLGADVTLVDSLIPEFGGNPANIADIQDRVRVNISDIRDVRGLRYLLRDCEYLFNLAGQTSHMDSMTAPFDDLEINCHAQLALLETVRTVNPEIKIVYASTRQVYGRPEYLPADEHHRLNPVDVNGINKIAGECYHTLYHNIHGLTTAVLRLTNVFGPGMRIKDARQIFLGIWTRRLLEGAEFEVWGGRQLRDFTYVDDVGMAFLLAAVTQEVWGRVWNVGGCPPISLLDLAELMLDLRGGGSYKLCEFPADRKKIDIGDYYSDDRAFRSLTGWAPQIDLRVGLARTLDYYASRMQHYV